MNEQLLENIGDRFMSLENELLLREENPSLTKFLDGMFDILFSVEVFLKERNNHFFDEEEFFGHMAVVLFNLKNVRDDGRWAELEIVNQYVGDNVNSKSYSESEFRKKMIGCGKGGFLVFDID